MDDELKNCRVLQSIKVRQGRCPIHADIMLDQGMGITFVQLRVNDRGFVLPGIYSNEAEAAEAVAKWNLDHS